jgi:hypothetical protein
MAAYVTSKLHEDGLRSTKLPSDVTPSSLREPRVRSSANETNREPQRPNDEVKKHR